jgi:hypothetical protein
MLSYPVVQIEPLREHLLWVAPHSHLTVIRTFLLARCNWSTRRCLYLCRKVSHFFTLFTFARILLQLSITCMLKNCCLISSLPCLTQMFIGSAPACVALKLFSAISNQVSGCKAPFTCRILYKGGQPRLLESFLYVSLFSPYTCFTVGTPCPPPFMVTMP